MIGIIGIKRLVVLIFFIAVNACLAGFVYMYLMPEADNQERRERVLRSEVSRIGADIDRLYVEFEQMDKQKDRYNQLKEKGFFSVQSRSDAKKMFSVLQNKSNVVSAVVNVKSGTILDDQDAQNARHKILVSQINIDIEAFDDVDVYKYIDLLDKTIPGHVSVDMIEMKRVRDVNAAVLRAISSGANPVMVKANLKLSWRTMVSEDKLTEDAE